MHTCDAMREAHEAWGSKLEAWCVTPSPASSVIVEEKTFLRNTVLPTEYLLSQGGWCRVYEAHETLYGKCVDWASP